MLQVVVASTRPGRKGPAFAEWFSAVARQHGGFEVVDNLAEVGPPFMDEPNCPRLGQCLHQHTLDWSASVVGAHSFVFVTPEYNYGYNAVVKNAIDYLHTE